MTGLSRCGRPYRTFDAAVLAAELRMSKGSGPLEVVGCSFAAHWHIVPKGMTIGQRDTRPDPFPPPVRSLLVKRDECCQRCGFTGRLEAHHRRAKASGGSSARSHTQCACNGVLLCRRCHEWVHLNPTKAKGRGFIVRQSVGKPQTIAVAVHFPLAPASAPLDSEHWSIERYPTCDGGWNDQP